MESTGRASKMRVPTARSANEGRSKAARPIYWKAAVTPAPDYHAAEESLLRLETVKSGSSKSVHNGVWKDYIDFCALQFVNPEKLSVSAAAQMANFYCFRTQACALRLSVSKHNSAVMNSFFSGLRHKGRWTTGVDVAQYLMLFGNPNISEDVVKVKCCTRIR